MPFFNVARSVSTVLANSRRLYDWWSRHPLARRVLYAVAFSGRETAFRRRAVEALSLSAGERVLDIGCGPGTDFDRLRTAVGPEGCVVGVDTSAGMVQAASERAQRWDNVHALRADATRLPCEGFDAAYAAMSLTAMPDVAAVAAAVASALRSAGRFTVLDADRFQRCPLTLLNPITDRLFALTTDWHPDHDVPDALARAFESVALTRYNAGTVFVATARLAD
jgi:demethylmenaquinone methyltransferase/2-methoxy-6-polyprenyl-1,4-benzoquinol methylase